MRLPEELPEEIREVRIELDDDQVIWMGPVDIEAGASIEPSGEWLHVLKPPDAHGRREITTYPACRIRAVHTTVMEPPAEPATRPGPGYAGPTL